jgi:hypothetical protein
MADDFYLPDETIEWLGLKKSSLLAWIIEHRPDSEFPLEQYDQHQDQLPEIIQSPDIVYEQMWDHFPVAIHLKNIQKKWMLSFLFKCPVLNENDKESQITIPQDRIVFVPILLVVAHSYEWLRPWFENHTPHKGKIRQ